MTMTMTQEEIKKWLEKPLTTPEGIPYKMGENFVSRIKPKALVKKPKKTKWTNYEKYLD